MQPFSDPVLCPRERAEDLLSCMTITEKVGQLNQRLYGFRIYERCGDEFSFSEEFDNELKRWGGLGVLYGLFRADPWSKRTAETGIPARLAAKAHNLVQKRVIEASRFGIPALMSSESPHGHQALDGYLLPVALAMGATFAPELVQSAFNVVGRQLKAQGVDLALVSVLDVLRDPRWGRSEECFGEDPLLCSVMAYAVVKGCMEQGVDTVAKHLCAQGETTGGLNASPASIGERELREIHLPPVKAATQAGTIGFMAAYNEIDGVPCHANPRLLRDILRDEFGFDGVVMADGTAIDRLDILTGNNTISGAMALTSGVDISLWDEGFTKLEEAALRGIVDESLIDEAALRVLTLKFKRSLFESPYLDEEKTALQFHVEEYPQSLELARQSAVLLKNENSLLPLIKGERIGAAEKNGKTRSDNMAAGGILEAPFRKVAVIGPAADDIYLGLGDYTPPIQPDVCVTLWEGLRKLAPPGMELVKAPGCSIHGGSQKDIDKAVALAKNSDVVVLAIGGSSSRFAGARFDINGAVIHDGDVHMDCGEGVDSASLLLPGLQHDLAKAIFETGKPVVTVIIAGRPYAIPDINNGTDALIYAFYPGPWGGIAIAELLFGVKNPSGRLPASLPQSSGQLPCYYNHKASDTEHRYCDLTNSPLYGFGYGLSYTTYNIDSVRAECKRDQQRDATAKGTQGAQSTQGDLSSLDTRIKVAFSISNTGEYSGYAVPMLYIRWLQGEITPREKELKAFTKIYLKPGENKDITLEIDNTALYRRNRDMKHIPGTGSCQLILEESGTVFWRGEIYLSEESICIGCML